MPQDPLLLCDVEPFDPDRLDSYLRRWRDGGGAIYGTILGLLVLAIASIPLVEVPVAVHATGLLRSRSETQTLVAPVGGWVRWVRPGEDRRVNAGDTLLVLDRPELARRAAALTARRRKVQAEVRDLEALLDGAVRHGPTGRLASARYLAERRRVDSEAALAEERLQAAVRERDRATALVSLGLAPAQEADALAARVHAVRAEAELLRSETLSGWQESLDAARENLRSLELEMSEVRQELRRLVIVARSSGDLDTLQAFAPGSYIAAGDAVARLTPASELVAELYIEPGQLGSVRRGSPARLQVSNLASSSRLRLRGRVYEIGPELVQVGSRVVGRLRVRLEGRSWTGSDRWVRLRRGTPVSARLPVGHRSLWDLLRGRAEPYPGAWPPASVPLRSAG